MTLYDIKKTFEEYELAKSEVKNLTELKAKYIYNSFDKNGKYINNSIVIGNHTFVSGCTSGQALLDSLSIDWDIFDIYIKNTIIKRDKLALEVQNIKKYLEEYKNI